MCHCIVRVAISFREYLFMDMAVRMCIIVKCVIYYDLMCMTFGIDLQVSGLEKNCWHLLPLLADMSGQIFYCVNMVISKTMGINIKHQLSHSHTTLQLFCQTESQLCLNV